MLETTPLARNSGGEWGFDWASIRRRCGVRFEQRAWPKAIKNFCAGEKPFSMASKDFPSAASVFRNAPKEIRRPPLSAVFSPKVRLPFTLTPGVASKPEYSSEMHFAR